MRRDHHVARLACKRGVENTCVVAHERVGVKTARLRFRHLLLGAQIGPGGVVELQVAATGVVEVLDRLLIGVAEILENIVPVRIDLGVDRAGLEPKMHDGRTWDRHLGRHLGVRFDEFEMLDEGMRLRKADLAFYARGLPLGLHALKLDAVVELADLDAVEQPVEIEMPP
jgi:hypothetical protein